MVLNPAIPTPQLLVAVPAAARNRPHCTTGCHRLGCCDQVRHRDLVPRDWRFACSWSSSAGVLGVRATWNGGLSRPEQPKTSSTLVTQRRGGETPPPGWPPPAGAYSGQLLGQRRVGEDLLKPEPEQRRGAAFAADFQSKTGPARASHALQAEGVAAQCRFRNWYLQGLLYHITFPRILQSLRKKGLPGSCKQISSESQSGPVPQKIVEGGS